MIPLLRKIIPGLLLLAFVTAGCNVFDGLYEEGTSKDVEVLLADAGTAMQKGQYQKAVKILETAHKSNPDNPVVRVDLSNALLRANDVTVMDLVIVAENINSKATSHRMGKAAGASCSFSSTSTIIGDFDYTNVDGFEKLMNNEHIFARVAELLKPVLPAIIQQIDAGHHYDRAALLETIRDSGLAQSRIDAMLMAYAASTIIGSYLNIFEDDAELNWYHVRGELGSEYIGYCATSETERERVEQRTACAVRRLGTAVIVLDIRAAFLRNAEGARDVADAAKEAYLKLRTELADNNITCG